MNIFITFLQAWVSDYLNSFGIWINIVANNYVKYFPEPWSISLKRLN